MHFEPKGISWPEIQALPHLTWWQILNECHLNQDYQYCNDVADTQDVENTLHMIGIQWHHVAVLHTFTDTFILRQPSLNLGRNTYKYRVFKICHSQIIGSN